MKYYYTYTIHFVDGYYYHGRRTTKCLPEHDLYFGTPKTHKEKWLTTQYYKVIESICNSPEELAESEYQLIGEKYKTDTYCLNQHNNKKWNNINKLPKCSDKTRKKLSEINKGKILSEKTKKILSEKAKDRYLKNPNINPMFNSISRENWVKVINSEEYKEKQLDSNKRKIGIYVDGIFYKSIRSAVKNTKIPYWYFENGILDKSINFSSSEYEIWKSNKISTCPISVMIDGISYSSLKEASKLTKISIYYMKKCLNENLKITTEGYKKFQSKKSIVINGVMYNSVAEASRETGHSERYIKEYYVLKIKSKKSIIFDGKEYSSIRESSRKTGIPRSYITKNYIKSENL
jgi:hypothetical protein